MIFDEMALDESLGAILAQNVKAGTLILRKGTILEQHHLNLLQKAGIKAILAAKMEAGDISEDAAAFEIGQGLISQNIVLGPATTGRINLFASQSGLFKATPETVNRINLLDPRVSLATIHTNTRVEAGQMVATIKIIPFAIPEKLIEQLLQLVDGRSPLALLPFKAYNLSLIQTYLPSTRDSVMDKTNALMQKKAARNGSKLITEKRTPHDCQSLISTLQSLDHKSDLTIIFSASAVADAADIVPRAIANAGGEILRIGMPVDPGNLLILAKLEEKYIVVAPGSARSAQENSLDWVLDHLMAGINLCANDLGKMGVGGLLL